MQIETTASWSKLLSIVHELSSAGETEPWNPHSLEVAPSEKTHLDAVDGEWFLGCAQFVKQVLPPMMHFILSKFTDLLTWVTFLV